VKLRGVGNLDMTFSGEHEELRKDEGFAEIRLIEVRGTNFP
jgi:hypothetical protein